jgi:hypothetical protein
MIHIYVPQSLINNHPWTSAAPPSKLALAVPYNRDRLFALSVGASPLGASYSLAFSNHQSSMDFSSPSTG